MKRFFWAKYYEASGVWDAGRTAVSATYAGVRLIPRKHVIPEYHRVTRMPGDDWRNGIDYREPPFSDWLIEAGLN